MMSEAAAVLPQQELGQHLHQVPHQLRLPHRITMNLRTNSQDAHNLLLFPIQLQLHR